MDPDEVITKTRLESERKIGMKVLLPELKSGRGFLATIFEYNFALTVYWISVGNIIVCNRNN
jgi:hypothetical protein